MVGVHGHDVVELCNRPIWSDIAFAAVVDRLLSAKPLEEQADRVFLEKARTRNINLVDRDESDLFADIRSEEHTSELQSLMSISYDVFCLKKKKITHA